MKNRGAKIAIGVVAVIVVGALSVFVSKNANLFKAELGKTTPTAGNASGAGLYIPDVYKAPSPRSADTIAVKVQSPGPQGICVQGFTGDFQFNPQQVTFDASPLAIASGFGGYHSLIPTDMTVTNTDATHSNLHIKFGGVTPVHFDPDAMVFSLKLSVNAGLNVSDSINITPANISISKKSYVGNSCTGSATSQTITVSAGKITVAAPSCGDSMVNGTDQCEGANLNSKNCGNAPGSPGPLGTLSCKADCSFDISACVAAASCGDGIVNGTDQCDDIVGTPVSGDGCSSGCQREANWSCSGTPSVCQCSVGYSQVGQACLLTDMCTTNPCGANSTCTKGAPGEYTCACNETYAGDLSGKNCQLKPTCTESQLCDPWSACDVSAAKTRTCNKTKPSTCNLPAVSYPITGTCNCATAADWDCAPAWTPAVCDQTGIQTRSCSAINCLGTGGKPATSQSCDKPVATNVTNCPATILAANAKVRPNMLLKGPAGAMDWKVDGSASNVQVALSGGSAIISDLPIGDHYVTANNGAACTFKVDCYTSIDTANARKSIGSTDPVKLLLYDYDGNGAIEVADKIAIFQATKSCN